LRPHTCFLPKWWFSKGNLLISGNLGHRVCCRRDWQAELQDFRDSNARVGAQCGSGRRWRSVAKYSERSRRWFLELARFDGKAWNCWDQQDGLHLQFKTVSGILLALLRQICDSFAGWKRWRSWSGLPHFAGSLAMLKIREGIEDSESPVIYASIMERWYFPTKGEEKRTPESSRSEGSWCSCLLLSVFSWCFFFLAVLLACLFVWFFVCAFGS